MRFNNSRDKEVKKRSDTEWKKLQSSPNLLTAMLPSASWCIVVLSIGSVITANGPAGPCHVALSRSLGRIGEYVPQCTDDGKFSTIQFHASSGYSWCVNEDGVEMENTRKGPGEGPVDCSDDAEDAPSTRHRRAVLDWLIPRPRPPGVPRPPRRPHPPPPRRPHRPNCSYSNWVDFVKSGCEKSWAEVQADSFSFECRGCTRMKELELELEQLRLLVVAVVGREHVAQEPKVDRVELRPPRARWTRVVWWSPWTGKSASYASFVSDGRHIDRI
ncbi:hypothetical protein LSAT2_014685 [Lamellibrachia satsuma]|nr:hypothetical protein LSAT2_014685 [Lamellibrachia satsuma]